jgi:hypothetical protein
MSEHVKPASLATRPEKREYSRQFGSHPGNRGYGYAEPGGERPELSEARHYRSKTGFDCFCPLSGHEGYRRVSNAYRDDRA